MALHGSEPCARVGCLSKRAPGACKSCCCRKVRCDVTRTKASCTNCRLLRKACVLPKSRRRHDGDRFLGSSLLEDKYHHQQSPVCDAIIHFSNNKVPLQLHYLDTATGLVGDGAFDVFDLSESPLAAIDIANPTKSLKLNDSVSSRLSSRMSFVTTYPLPALIPLEDPHRHWRLTNYITPITEKITEEDISYLASKGLSDLPHSETTVHLPRAYARWVHPFAPMLDLEETLTVIASDGKKGTLSLLVFRSMLSAASA